MRRWPAIGTITWVVIAGTMAVIGYTLGGWRLALLSGGTFVWIAVMGQWKWAMETLSVIVVAAPLSILLGLLMGAAAWRWRWVEQVMHPLLTIAQHGQHLARRRHQSHRVLGPAHDPDDDAWPARRIARDH